MTTPASAAAMAFVLSLLGVVAFMLLEGWVGTALASALVVALATGGAWAGAQRRS